MKRTHHDNPRTSRRTIAVGILGRRAGRTITIVRSATGTTGSIRRDSHLPAAPAPAVTA